MLKIIPDIDRELFLNNGLYSFCVDGWGKLGNLSNKGILFEYYEDDIINFKFLYALGNVIIHKGPFTENFTKDEMQSFFTSFVKMSELWTWIDNDVDLKVKTDISCNSGGEIHSLWKLVHTGFYSGKDDERKLSKSYFEFEMSVEGGEPMLIRSFPKYNELLMGTVPEKHGVESLYWFTICLIKYLRMLNPRFGE